MSVSARVVSIVVLLNLGLVPAWAFAAQATVLVSGAVVADADGQPVSDALVALEGTPFAARTDAAGRFSMAGVPPGRYQVAVSRDGFETVREVLEVRAGTPASLDVRLPLSLDLRESVIVGGRTVGELGLDTNSRVGSRLGLTAMEIPASIDVLDSTVMEARGYQKVSDAVSSMAGVVAGEHPTAPSSFVVRGVTASQVSNLRDGIWLGPSTMVMRPQNTFNLDRVELLRGPSSVLNGQGAVAGTINAVTKTAEPSAATRAQGLISYGRFDTYHLAGGVTGPVTDGLWYRVDASRSGSAGYVPRMDSSSTNVTGSLLWRPTRRLRMKASVDVLDDSLGKYFGTPLLPTSAAAEPMDVIRTTTGEAIDARTRFVNYNVSDGEAVADHVLLRGDVTWDLTDRISLTNIVYGYDAQRNWRNAEGYVYCTTVVDVCTTPGDIQRYYGYFIIRHDQQIVGDRLTLAANGTLGGRENKALLGVEASTLDFTRTRGFRISVPPAAGDSVNLLSPVPGVYGPEEIRGISPTGIDSWGVFLEDALKVAPRVSLVGALRYDGLDLERVNLTASGAPAAGGFTRNYTWWSWRAGTVVNLTPQVMAYGQYSNAKDPVSANILLVNANQNFDLTEARQWEVGMKADVNGGRTQVTAAWFDIDRDDVLERFALDSATNIGGVSSSGLELAGTFRVGEPARIGANLGYTRSSFRPSPNFVRFAGNRLPNVPRLTTNLWASYQGLAGMPLEVGGSARYVGDRFANNANSITMTSYALADVYAAWTHRQLRVTARIDNLTDTAFASWSDIFYLGQNSPSFLYANQLMIGPPRQFSVMLQVGF